MSQQASLQQAIAAFQAGRLVDAETILATLRKAEGRQADVWRVSGAVARASKRPDLAETYLRKAVELDPQAGDAWNTLGLLLDSLARTDEAIEALEKARQLMPSSSSPAINLGRIWVRQKASEQALAVLEPFLLEPAAELVYAQALQAHGQPAEALKRYGALARKAPGNPRIAFGEALCRLDQGEWEAALTRLNALAAQGVAEAHYPRFTALARMGRIEEAFGALQSVLSRDPTHSDALHGAAQLYWMTDQGDQIQPLYDMAINASGGAPAVYIAYVNVMVQMEEFDRARFVLQKALDQHGPTPWQLERSIHVEIEAEQTGAAWTLAQRAESDFPDEFSLFGNRSRAGLMAGEPGRVRELIQAARIAMPQDRFWVGMEASLARIEGRDADYARLVDMDSFVRTFAIEPPAGYSSIKEFNQSLAECLRRLHAFAAAPLDQSLRSGVQTPSDLRFREDPEILAFFAQLREAVAEYREGLTQEAGHPLTGAIPATTEIQGAWSVRLGPGGRHVNHVHPEGWISSVYYVSVPEQVAGSEQREGWLKFGEPPFPVEGLAPHDYVEPVPGQLTLFPSYLWHGTVPIQSGERLTIALDIKPA